MAKKTRGQARGDRRAAKSAERRKVIWGGRRQTDMLAAAGVTRNVLQRLSMQLRSTGKATMHRGRVAGRYMASKHTKAMRGVNETVTGIFKAIQAAGAAGVTQRELQESLSLPHSTVWYGLGKLKKRNAVSYQTVGA